MSNNNNKKRGTKRQAPTESSNQSEMNENLSADDGMSVPGTATYDENLSQISGGKRRRKKFSPTARAHVAKVRKAGACSECRARKVKCEHALGQGTDANSHADLASAPKPSPQQLFFGFDTPCDEISYPGVSWENEAIQWPQSDAAQLQDPTFNEGADLINSIPASTIRKERLTLEINEFNNIIEDNLGSNAAKSVPNNPEWGQKSEWMLNATMPPNDQQFSQPSHTTYSYSNPNLSNDGRPLSSTPVSSSGGLHSQDAGFYLCTAPGCGDTRIFTESIQLRYHQETMHVDLFPSQITHACKAVGCKKRYASRERLQTHIRCTHIETLEKPIHATSNDYENDMESAKLAQVNEFVSQQYLAGVEDNPIALPDQRTFHETQPLADKDWLQDGVSRRTCQQRFRRKPNMQRSTSPMQRQPSAGTANNFTSGPIAQPGMASFQQRIGSAVANSTTSLQDLSLQGQHTIEQMGSFNAQLDIPQSYPQRTNSPTPSFIGNFGSGMHISDNSEIGEENRHGMFATMNNGLLNPSATFALHDQSMVTGNERTCNDYNNLQRTGLQNDFRSGYNGPSFSMPAWPGQGSSTLAPQQSGFIGDYELPGFQVDVPDPQYFMNDQSLLNIPVMPSHTEQPMFMLHTKPIRNPDFSFGQDDLALERVMSHPDSAPHLEYTTSTISSSGTSDSVLSLADAQAQTSFPGKYGDDWDMTYDMNQNDDTV